MSTAFAPFSIWWLAPIALALHMFSLYRAPHPYINAYLFALASNAIALHWTSTFVGSLPWVVLFLGQSIFFLPLGLVTRYGMAFYPLILLITEQIRVYYPFNGFGWLRIAYSQADAPYRHIGAFGGAVAISAIVLCIALTIYSLIRLRIYLIPLVPLLFVFVPTNLNIVGTTSALLIQGDVPKLGLEFNERAKAVFYNHVLESKKALSVNENIDFILWPENAVDVDPFTTPEVRQSLNSFAKPLIIGAVTRNNGRLQNTSILWKRNSQEIYVKQHLTPFGEYIPLRAFSSKISSLTDLVEDFSPGDSSKIFTIGKAQVAPIICFELIDDEILAQAAKKSNLIVVQTNSATFGKSPESAQQLEISRIRAIEHGRNILSVSTIGISAQIDYEGNIVSQTGMHEARHIFAKTGLIEKSTPRDQLGHLALLATLAWLFLVGFRGRSRID